MDIIEPSEFKAPHYNYDFIRNKADEFRNMYWNGKTAPVDILLIAEENLGIDFIPIDNLKSNNDIEALLLDVPTVSVWGNIRTPLLSYSAERIEIPLKYPTGFPKWLRTGSIIIATSLR